MHKLEASLFSSVEDPRMALGSEYLLDFAKKERSGSTVSGPAPKYPLNISDGPNDTWKLLDLQFNPHTMSYAKLDFSLSSKS
jgi:hypothetical protein